MEQTNKLNWIKKVTPLLYSLSLAGICLYIALRCRSWANLLLPWETGFVFFPLAAVYYLSNQLLCKNIWWQKTAPSPIGSALPPLWSSTCRCRFCALTCCNGCCTSF